MSSTPGDLWEGVAVCMFVMLAGMLAGSCLGRTFKQIDNTNICAVYCQPAEYTMNPLCICKETP